MTQFFTFLLLALPGLSLALHRHDCVHDKVLSSLPTPKDADEARALKAATLSLNGPATRQILAERENYGKRTLLQQAEAQSMRFHVEYMLDQANEAFAQVIRSQVMRRALRALSRALKLRAPVTGNLKLPRTCSRILTRTGECAGIGELCWGNLPQDVPESYFGDTEVCNGISCETTEGGEGIPDADFAVFVSAMATPACSPTTGAHAVTCSRDEASAYGLPERPLVGYINFCPPQPGEGVPDDPKSIDGLVDTAVHELIHTLFMSSNLYEHYIKSDRTALGADFENESIVKTPAVRQAVRDQFDCPNAAGAPLEQNGGSATSGSHWESTTFQNEIMIGASAAVERRVLSPITLGLAQDSGWYVPNWSAVGFLRHGHKLGCDMLEACGSLGDSSPAQSLYCDVGQTPGCLYHEKGAWCTDTALTDCAVLQPLNNGDCKNPENLVSRLSSTTATSVGIYYGPQAICIGVPNGQLARNLRTWRISEACVAAQCADDGSLKVLIKDTTSSDWTSYDCPEGGNVELGLSSGFASDTKLGPCPAASEVCPYKGCPVNNDLMCSLQGNCFDKQCYCAVDKSGVDCSQTLCDVDEDCVDGQFCTAEHECSWGTAPPPPPPAPPFTDTLVTDFGDDNFNPMRAVRVGYMQQCVFFDDANGDGQASVSGGEKSQPSGPKGEVALYVQGESDTTNHIIRQDQQDVACTDTLTRKKSPRMLFAVAAGVPTQETSIGLFSTATLLEMEAAGLNRNQAVQAVATAYGVDVSQVHGRDWLHIMTSDNARDQRDTAANIGLVSVASVVTTEQVAAFLAGGELTTAYNVSNMFVRQVTAGAGGQVMAKLQDATWLTNAMAAAAQEAAVEAGDSSNAALVADAIVRVNSRLVEVKESSGTDVEKLLTGWAKVAHVGDVLFAQHSEDLASGKMDEASYRNSTSAASLAAGEAAHNVDLPESTLLDDPSFFDRARENLRDWLYDDHFGLYGWVWVMLGAIAVLLFCCVCSWCTTCTRKRRAKQAHQVHRELHVANAARAPEPVIVQQHYNHRRYPSNGAVRVAGESSRSGAGPGPGSKSPYGGDPLARPAF